MNLFARYAALKKKVGGNREKRRFEFTMGRSVAEANRITEPSPSIRRILSETLFALELSKRHDGRFDGEIAAALDILERCMAEEGVLTKTACMQAEEALLPLKSAAREYEVIYASHAHIDMNWMWGWQETVAVALSTFRTMLNLMKEYPDFTFSQSQASVYKIVEEYDPDMMDEIKARIAEGRWEVTANAWVETDKNMPDTESLLRHISVTRDYLRDVWGVTGVKVDFSPDTFGHSRNVPEINLFGSVPYYYHCRGLQDDLTLYRFRAPSGSELLMYKEPYWYNSGVNPDNGTGVFEMERRCAGLKTALIVYGVGNHGGGPTRRDIEAVLEMQQWPIFPTLSFGTLQEFFEKAESVRENLPVVDHELNAIFTGCYSTQSRIKLANRRAEAALLDSERHERAVATWRWARPSRARRYDKAWQNTLFTHFHDILDRLLRAGEPRVRHGQAGRGHRARAQCRAGQAPSKSSPPNVDTSMLPGGRLHFRRTARPRARAWATASPTTPACPIPSAARARFASTPCSTRRPWRRHELTELTRLGLHRRSTTSLEVVDHEGRAVAFQLLRLRAGALLGSHTSCACSLRPTCPPMGHAVYADRAEKEVSRLSDPSAEGRARGAAQRPRGAGKRKDSARRFDTGSGLLRSLVDKATGEELLAGSGRPASGAHGGQRHERVAHRPLLRLWGP